MPPLPRKSLPTTFAEHKDKWKDGCGSEFCSTANRVVLYRGDLPCDVLFVGEAPGQSEDTRGIPFDGPAGQVLDRIIRRATKGIRVCATCRRGNVLCSFPCKDNPYLCQNGHAEEDAEPLRVGFTNMVGCMPRTSEDGKKAGEPTVEQVDCCHKRLQEIVDMARPRLLVRTGRIAQKEIEPGTKASIKLKEYVKLSNLVHPAYILRAPTVQQGLLEQQAVANLVEALEGLLCLS